MGYIGNQPFLGTATGEIIADGSIGTVDLSDGAVTAAKLATTAILDKLGFTPVPATGAGASGTWPISITGNAATATSLSGGSVSATTGSFSGDLSLTGVGRRITGDFSNATVANRVLFQSSTTNGNSEIGVMPNGTGAVAGWNVYGTSTTAATTVARFDIPNNTETRLLSGRTDASVSFIPMTFYTGGSERMRLTTAGEFAVGFGGNSGQGILQVARTISGGGPATSGTTDANQVMAFNASSVQLGYGAYANGTGWIQQRATANYATNYDLVLQPNGGNVGIGVTPTANLDVRNGAGNCTISAQYGTGTKGQLIAANNEVVLKAFNGTNDVLTFYTGASERMRIDSSGNVGIGKTPAAGRLLDVNADSWFNGVRVGRGSLSNNTIVGSNALISTTTGDFNVAIGFEAGNANTTGYQNTFIGYRAGLMNTTAIFNTGIGCNALQAATTGAANTAVGNQSLQLTTTGGNNSAVGVYALYANTTGTLNTAIGYAASMGQTTAVYNVAVGAYALHYGTTAIANTGVGYYALLNATTGGSNTAVGYYAGSAITTGTHNVMIGQQAGNYSVTLATGAGNICVGNYSEVQAPSDNYSIVIGYLAQGKGTSTGFIAPYNGGSMYQGNNSSSWATTSDRRIKKNIVDCTLGLEKINQIRVCNFEYRTKDEIDPSIPQSSAVPKAGIQLGVIAQEIQQIIPESVKEESTGVLSVDTDRVIWHLVNAVKELSAQVDALKARIGE